MFKRTKNRKGFMLIELMAVVAIISVLVAIIVPVVTENTTKSAAAANAANIRSIVGKLAVMKASNENDFDTSYSANVKRAGQIIVDGASPILKWLGWDNFPNWAELMLYEVTADSAGKLYWMDSNKIIIEGVPGAKEMKIPTSDGGELVIAENTPMTVYLADNAISGSYYTLSGKKLSLEDFADIAEDGVYDGGVTNSSGGGNFWENVESGTAIGLCILQGKHNPDPCYCSNCKQLDHVKSETEVHVCDCGTTLSVCGIAGYEQYSDTQHKCKICPETYDHFWDNYKCATCDYPKPRCSYNACPNLKSEGSEYCYNHQLVNCDQQLNDGSDCTGQYNNGGTCPNAWNHAIITTCPICNKTGSSIYNGKCFTHRNWTLCECGTYYGGDACTNTTAHGHECTFSNHKCTYEGCNARTSCNHVAVIGTCYDCNSHKDNCVTCGTNHTCSHTKGITKKCTICNNGKTLCPVC